MTFIATAVAIVVGGILVTWPFVAQEARRAVAGAGILALGTQLPTHFLLRGWRDRTDRFFLAIGAGFAVRFLVVILGAVFFVLPGRVEPFPFLHSLGGFLVAVLFAESLFEQRRLRAGGSPGNP